MSVPTNKTRHSIFAQITLSINELNSGVTKEAMVDAFMEVFRKKVMEWGMKMQKNISTAYTHQCFLWQKGSVLPWRLQDIEGAAKDTAVVLVTDAMLFMFEKRLSVVGHQAL